MRALTLALACVALLALDAASALAQPPSTLTLGTQTLTLCQSEPVAYCGTLSVPLDREQSTSPPISIAYRFYPAREPPGGVAAGTVVPVEGGPGYPSIESVSYEDDGAPAGYSAMYGPLLDRYNMLAVDNRGTGESTPIDCSTLQTFSGPTGTSVFQLLAAECAESLNHRWRYPNGEWVHASDLFTSAPAAEDLASVIRALELGKVNLYGDSYGSWFAEVFASRYPQLLRSVILDSTYQTIDLDPWYRSSVNAMPTDFDDACVRSPACAAAESEPAWTRISELAQRLRESPVEGVVPGPEGKDEHVQMGSVGLVNLINDAAGDTRVYRDLDAAARALLDAGDPAPLLRLYAQRLAEDESYFHLPVSEYSVGLYLAVSCLDYPQLFQMSATPAVRAEQLAAAEATLAPTTFAPFSTQEWLEQDQNTEAYTACLDWPAPVDAQPPVTATPPLLPSSLPVLVLGGELDTWTPPAEVPTVMKQIGGHARFIELANSTHVVGEGDTQCGSTLVRAFVEHPELLDLFDARCAAAVAPIHAVGVYAASLAEEPPLEASGGEPPPPLTDLRLAAAAVSTAGDAISRYQAIEAKLDHGLAGGSVKASDEGRTLKLKGDQLVPGVAVSGTVTLSEGGEGEEGQSVSASLRVHAGGLHTAKLTATWSTTGARAEVSGTIGHQAIAGSMPAP